MKKIFLITIALTSSLIISGQSISGHYVFKPKKRITIFGLLPHFQSSGFLDINLDSTYHAENYWESFMDQSSGTWRLFNDTLMLYANKNELYGDQNYESYCYSYFRSDTVIDRNIFAISSINNNSIPKNNSYIFIGQTKEKIQFNDGIYTLQSPSFDSLIIEFDSRFNFNKVKVAKPVCCGENVFEIMLGLRIYRIDKNKIRDLKGRIVFKKNNNTKP